MPRILLDPNGAQCPDYDLPEHAQTVALLAINGADAAQAAQILKNIWQINQDRDKLAWQLQEDADIVEAQNRQQQKAIETAAREAEMMAEQDAQDKEERKRNKDKYTHIPLDRPIPMQPHDIPSTYALRKLEKCLYLPLWYLTNDGLDSARRSNITADTNSMVVVRNDDGTTSWQAAAQPARGALEDEDLTWEAVCNACPLFIKAAVDAQWTDDRVDMLAGFFGGVLSHRWRGSRDPLELRALHVYMSEQRRLWHAAIAIQNGGYNLSIFNEALLRDTYERVYREDRRKQDAFARRVNTSVYSLTYLQSHMLTLYSFSSAHVYFSHYIYLQICYIPPYLSNASAAPHAARLRLCRTSRRMLIIASAAPYAACLRLCRTPRRMLIIASAAPHAARLRLCRTLRRMLITASAASPAACLRVCSTARCMLFTTDQAFAHRAPSLIQGKSHRGIAPAFKVTGTKNSAEPA